MFKRTYMAKAQNKRNNQSRGNAVADALEIHDFDQLAGSEGVQVEHQTVPGFLRRIPHKWHLDEVTRFGDKVGRAAEAMQLGYITRVDSSLGVIRVFPLPLLQRIYLFMAPAFNWPRIVELDYTPDENKREKLDALRRSEKMEQHLRDFTEQVDDTEVLSAAQSVREFLSTEIGRLRAELDGRAPAAEEPKEPAVRVPVVYS